MLALSVKKKIATPILFAKYFQQIIPGYTPINIKHPLLQYCEQTIA